MVETVPDRLAPPDRMTQWLDLLRERVGHVTDGIDPLVLVGGAMLAVFALWIVLGMRRAARAEARAAAQAAEFAEIKGRLTAMSEMTVRRQSDDSHALDDRVEQVSVRLGAALDGVSRRLSDSLAETQRQNVDTAARLSERVVGSHDG